MSARPTRGLVQPDDYTDAKQAWRKVHGDKAKGTVLQPYPGLTGHCGIDVPAGDPSHARCSGDLGVSPSVGYVGCICPCHLSGVTMCGPGATAVDLLHVREFAAALRSGDPAAALAQQERDRLPQPTVATVTREYETHTTGALQQQAVRVTVTGERWVWEPDVAADLMVQEPECPMCLLQWDAHSFTDSDQVVCP